MAPRTRLWRHRRSEAEDAGDLGRSSDPDAEREVLDDVASYGRRLGRMGDALAVLLDHLHPERRLTGTERDAVDDLRSIARVKRRRARRR